MKLPVYFKPMKTIQVQVQNDFLDRMTRVPKPIFAIAELIWNSLDADATRVSVAFDRNHMDGIDRIRITDDGHGMHYDSTLNDFAKLGGSWKSSKGRSRTRSRVLHGKEGKGRFRAFHLGHHVEWLTVFERSQSLLSYSVVGRRTNLGVFEIGDPTNTTATTTGTEVVISDVPINFRSLLHPDKPLQELAQYFAFYLKNYPGLQITYNSKTVHPALVLAREEHYTIDPVHLDDGRMMEAVLTIIEWKVETDRQLYLCDPDGFTLSEVAAGIRAPGFNFTAYLKSRLFRELGQQNVQLGELHPDIKQLIDAAKAKLREHFRKRADEATALRIQEWKELEIYPYAGEPTNTVERSERQVFEVCALQVSDSLQDFEASDLKTKKLTFRLLKQAIRSGPDSLSGILSQVLDLPKDKQEEFAALLKKTSLTKIINAAKLVADRLEFLAGLSTLVFNREWKSILNERNQLHNLIAENAWIFGEQFNLTNELSSLNDVLTSHLGLLRKDEDAEEEILLDDGRQGFIDLMLSRTLPMPHPDEHEHLIVELKRPSVKINSKVALQIQGYALAVASDERFRNTKTRWTFWAVSNDLTEEVKRMSRQRGRAEGILFEDATQQLTVWVKPWAEVISEASARLNFFKQGLQYDADSSSGMEHLRRMYDKYIPKAAQINA